MGDGLADAGYRRALERAALTFAMTTSSVNGTDRASSQAVANTAERQGDAFRR